MQTDPNLTLQKKLMDHIPVLEIEIETEAKAPEVSSSNISEVAPFSGEIHLVVDEHLINQLKALGLYDKFLAKQPSDDPDINIAGFYTFSSISEVNLIETNDLEDILKTLPNRTEPLDLVHVQQIDKIIREVNSWKNRGHPGESPNLPITLRRYR